jgi:pimeloyl-ACP methyl ester carboxylesterase
MKNTNQGTVTVEGGKRYYEVAGSGEPLVLCHAGFVDSGMWESQWDVMEQGIPGARKVVIVGAAHLPNMEKPAEFNREVLGWMLDAGLSA